jgi:hypothetical protein
MDLPVHREAQDDAGGARLDDLDVEKFVDALAAIGQRDRVTAGTRRGCGHRRMLTVPR